MSSALYVETSALLRFLLEGEVRLADTLRSTDKRLVTSSLTAVEASRALLRATRDRRIDARQQQEALNWLRAFMRSCEVVSLGEIVLERAAQPFPAEPIRTLDALHLASALLWDEQIEGTLMLSCDHRVRDNARALGLEVQPESL